jgi:signal transduction histidine kinase
MKLTTRVSAFFLGMLAATLAIFSLVIYSVASGRIRNEFEHDMRSTLNALVAAAEVEATEVKWQPLDHAISFGLGNRFDEISWAVIGDQHRTVEASRNASKAFLDEAKRLSAVETGGGVVDGLLQPQDPYRFYYRRLVAPQPGQVEHLLDEFDELTVVVGRSIAQRNQTLRQLAMLIVGLPLLAWCAAAAFGVAIVRRALRPVATMASQAHAIEGSDFQSRLQVDPSGDELTELGHSFNRVLDRQQIAIEQQRRFAGDAAHELRTPLTALRGNIEVTLRRPRAAAEYEATLQSVLHGTTDLQEIVESLLFLARQQSDATLPTLEPLPARQWLTDYWNSWSDSPRFSDLTLRNQIADGTNVSATGPLLARLLGNLISNAIKYSDPGSPITVDAADDGNSITIRVSDSGRGIAQQDVGHVFEPFFRTRDSREQGISGTGLGLPIASRVAEVLGGGLTCESQLGQGSAFTLRLPKMNANRNADAIAP